MSVYNVYGSPLSRVYGITGQGSSVAYDINGTPITADGHYVSDTYTSSVILDLSESGILAGTQGIACDSITKTIAQLYSGKIIMIDITDGSMQQVASSFNMGHGSTGQFAPTKTSEQVYPLLYVSNAEGITVDETKYSPLLEVQCSESASTMKRVLCVSEEENLVGHFAIDFENSIAYHIYAEEYKSTTATVTYISVWDMTSAELTTDITYSPRPSDGVYLLQNHLDKFTVPFINQRQSDTFFDGLIACLSDDGYVRFIDPGSKSVYLTITQDLVGFEREGIGYLLNEQTNRYDMILSNRDGDFRRYVFA